MIGSLNFIKYVYPYELIVLLIRFCKAPKNLERLLTKAGAHRFYKSDWADDAVGLDGAPNTVSSNCVNG